MAAMPILPRPEASPEAARPTPESPWDLFKTFSLLALQAFGGLVAVAQRVLCEERRWLTKPEFVEFLAVGQILPGPNVCNLALMIGNRFFGLRGALAALAGLFAAPLVIVLTLSVVYVRYASHPAVAGALKGMGAVSAGLIVGTAIRLAGSLRHNAMGLGACVAVGATVFMLIAFARLPLPRVLLAVGACSCAYAWYRLRGGDRDGG